NLQITNDVLEHNGGVLAGGIGVGQPYVDGHNANLHVLNTRVLGNGGINRSGGIGLFRGSDNYEIGASVFCANFGVGIAIQQEVPRPTDPLVGTGSGAVNVDRNLIQSNYSGDDGGGIFVSGALTAAINIRNNQIVDNGAADNGGA